MDNKKEINEKMANFVGLKKVKDVKTVIGNQTYVTKEIWVHKFDPVQDGQMIYNDNFPQKELVKESDIVTTVNFDDNRTLLVELYDHCQSLLSGIKQSGFHLLFEQGDKILSKAIRGFFNIDTYDILNEFIDWYDVHKKYFGYSENNA